jgi:hypothetical protein
MWALHICNCDEKHLVKMASGRCHENRIAPSGFGDDFDAVGSDTIVLQELSGGLRLTNAGRLKIAEGK